MLKCKEAAEMASDYIDKQLGWKDSFSMRAHLLMCVQCRRFVNHLLSAIGLARRARRQTASPAEVENTIVHVSSKASRE